MRKFGVLALLIAVIVGCAKVPITERKQFNLLPESQLMGMSATAYQQFLDTNRVMPATDAQKQMVDRVGQRMQTAITAYLESNGYGKRVKNYTWEFNLVDDPTVNAWCMPGGKIVFYTGILPITQGEVGVATVMGHEVAHALANHGQQRMSAAYLQAGIAVAGNIAIKDEQTRNIFNQINEIEFESLLRHG